MNCNHTIGQWSECDESGLVLFSDWKDLSDDSIERFKFCPDCGENIESLVSPPKTVHEESEFSKKCSEHFNKEILPKYIEKARNASKLLRSLTYPENQGKTIGNIVTEREFPE